MQTAYAAPIAAGQDVTEDGQQSEAEPQDEQETGEAQAEDKEVTGEAQQEDGGAAENNSESAGEGSEVSAPSAVLIEASTGQVIYDKNAHEQLPPASVTKVMTMLLIFDAIEAGKISLKDEVVTSEYAASMGGSQVFLEPGETQTVDTMLKCIAVASANDACVAMAEYINGTEEEFIKLMNERAEGLGMEDTTFKNCNGLDADGHVTTAYDIALMSGELITKYPEVFNYTQIWMENITHVTNKGTSEFGLSNTNKLIKQYPYATGLKTGSTSKAKFCLSATAKKDNVELIAVIMAAEDSTNRLKDAINLLNYGFGKCNLYEEEKLTNIDPAEVKRGVEKTLEVAPAEEFRYVDTTGADLSLIEKKVTLEEEIKAPVKKGDQVGRVEYYLDGEKIGTVPILAGQDVDEITYISALFEVLFRLLL